MATSSMTGFDPEIVSQSIGKVISAYEELIGVLGDKMQSDFVGGMQDKWACTQAQKFFTNSFKPAIDSIITSSNSTFESVVASMNSAGQAWAARTESSYSPVSFTPTAKTIDAGVILENIGGVRGIDKANAENVANKLPGLASDAESALSNAQSAVQNSGFIGGSQQANLVESLGQIKTKIDEVVTNVTTETKTAIQSTIEAYGDTEGKISEAFTLQG